MAAGVQAIIAAGNCCVIKPSEIAPNSATVTARLVEKYLDPACFRVVAGGVVRGLGRVVLSSVVPWLVAPGQSGSVDAQPRPPTLCAMAQAEVTALLRERYDHIVYTGSSALRNVSRPTVWLLAVWCCMGFAGSERSIMNTRGGGCASECAH